jgi:hypothetical protein
MDRNRLKGYLDQGLSLEQIAVRENRDPSTVGHWVKRHGLIPNGRVKYAARGGLAPDELRPLVDAGLTLAEIALAVDRSQSSVRYWLRRHGLKTTGRRGPRPIVPREKVERARAEGRRTLDATCPHHGEAVFVIEASGRARCRQCRMDRVAARRREVKRILAEEAGGKCVRCGYNRFLGALQFHHRDRKTKLFGLSQKGATIGIDKLREEARKCTLVCANCHAELEHGMA